MKECMKYESNECYGSMKSSKWLTMIDREIRRNKQENSINDSDP